MPRMDRGRYEVDAYQMGQRAYLKGIHEGGDEYESLPTESEKRAFRMGYNQELHDCVQCVMGAVPKDDNTGLGKDAKWL